MNHAITLVRVLPLAFMGRLGIAFVEITLAAVVVSGSVVLGHDLAAWRAWYWDPSTLRYWAPTAAPIATVPPAPLCPPSTTDEDLAFASSGGVDCVWFAARGDGAHLVVQTAGMAKTDVALVAPRDGLTHLRTFVPVDIPSPVLVVTGTTPDRASVFVFTWAVRGYTELLRASGQRIEVASGRGGWPAVTVTMPDGHLPRVHTYRWDGARYSEP